MYIEWSELAAKRKWCPAELWKEAMSNIKQEPEVLPEVELEPIAEEEMKETSTEVKTTQEPELSQAEIEARLMRQERGRRAAETNLKKDPDYYKKISAKAHAKKEQK